MTPPRQLTAQIGAASYTLETGDDGHLVVTTPSSEPRALRSHYLGHGRVEVVVADARHLAYVVEDDATRWVFVDGRVFEVTLEDASRPVRRPRAAGHDQLAAPMPASVVKVLVAPGQRVVRGTTLVLLEAMKMELPLKAPHDAMVVAVRCAEGELVQPGIALVELEVVPAGEHA